MARNAASPSWLGCGSLLLACASTVLLRADGPRLAGITLLADRLDLVSQVHPDRPPDELARTAAEPHVLGRLPAPHPGVGEESSPDGLLVSETLSRSVVSYSLCADAAVGACGQVRLHYTSAGLAADEGEPSAILSSSVGLELRSGWFLGFDAASNSLLAFRRVAPHRYEDEAGRGHAVVYRSPRFRDGKPDTSSKNFGRGNGLLLSVVLEGAELARQTSSPARPLIERLVELAPGKVLLIFSTGTLRALHLLELEEVEASVPYDLDDAENLAKLAPV